MIAWSFWIVVTITVRSLFESFCSSAQVFSVFVTSMSSLSAYDMKEVDVCWSRSLRSMRKIVLSMLGMSRRFFVTV